MDTSEMTRIGGFFNGNSYPISLAISQLGVTITLNPGQFITVPDENGKPVKVNDAIFSKRVGKGFLSKETLDREVPVIKMAGRQETIEGKSLRATSVVGTHNGHGTPGAPVFQQAKQAIPTTRVETAKPGEIKTQIERTPIRTGGITAMTMEEAVRTGRVRPMRMVELNGPPDTEGLPPPIHTVPSLAESLPTDFVQGKAKPVTLTVNPDPLPEIPEPAKVMDTSPPISMEDLAEAEQNITYTCPACSPEKSFDFRSSLDQHAKRAHPDQHDEIMAKYPPKKKT